MKWLLSFVLACFLQLTSAQIEIFGGVNSNTFHDFKNYDRPNISRYHSDLGMAYGFAYYPKNGNVKYVAQFEKYGGQFYVSNGGLGGGTAISGNINKSVFSGSFLYTLSTAAPIELNLGLQLSYILMELKEGEVVKYLMPNSTTYEINAYFESMSTPLTIGLSGQLIYRIKLTDKVDLTPQYHFYYGLTDEFKSLPDGVKSMRHFIGVGIKTQMER